MKSDEQLFLLLQLGDDRSFTAIYERYHKMLYAFAYRYLKSSYLSEDAVQYVFMKLWEKREIIDIQISLKSYLYSFLKNHILNEIRNNTSAVEKLYRLAQTPENHDEDILEKLSQKDFLEKIQQSIDKLPEQKKRVCELKLTGSYSNQEIADLMQISIPTVKTHYAQAIKMLRVMVDKLIMLIGLLFIQ